MNFTLLEIKFIGFPTTPKLTSIRMIFWISFMMCYLLFAAYSATLISQLAVRRSAPLPFKDFYGLVSVGASWDAGSLQSDLFEVQASVIFYLSISEIFTFSIFDSKLVQIPKQKNADCCKMFGTE